MHVYFFLLDIILVSFYGDNCAISFSSIDDSNQCSRFSYQKEKFIAKNTQEIKYDVFSGELAERIWCLYIVHVRGSHLLHGATSAQ